MKALGITALAVWFGALTVATLVGTHKVRVEREARQELVFCVKERYEIPQIKYVSVCKAQQP